MGSEDQVNQVDARRGGGLMLVVRHLLAPFRRHRFEFWDIKGGYTILRCSRCKAERAVPSLSITPFERVRRERGCR